MLPSWLEHVRLSLHPAGLDAVILRAGDHKLLRHQSLETPLSGDAYRWEPALRMLPSLLSELSATHRDTEVVISGAWTHFLMLPWQDALGGDAEWLAFARHAYISVYGHEAEHWQIRLTMQGYGKPVMACAMDASLTQGIIDTLTGSDCRISRITPFFTNAYNRYRKKLQIRDSWLALTESGRLQLARIEDGCIVHMVARRIDGNTHGSVSEVIRRELERSVFGQAVAPLFFHSADGISVPAGLSEHVRVVPLESHLPFTTTGMVMALC